MADELDLDSTTLAQRVALLGVIDREIHGETPTHSGEIRQTATDHLERVDSEVVGKFSEAEVMRALNELEAGGLLERVEVEDTSPVGKGRPTYVPGVDVEEVLETYADDARVAGVVEYIRTEETRTGGAS